LQPTAILVSGPDDETLPVSNLVLTNSTDPGHPERPYHALVAGAVGGYFIWGRYSSVNYQIVLYLTSRVLVGLWKRHWLRNHSSAELLPEILAKRSYAIGAATVWGLVMFLFESHPEVLHPSLRNSMDEIYR
jgi:peroxisomal membrane protein 4